MSHRVRYRGPIADGGVGATRRAGRHVFHPAALELMWGESRSGSGGEPVWKTNFWAIARIEIEGQRGEGRMRTLDSWDPFPLSDPERRSGKPRGTDGRHQEDNLDLLAKTWIDSRQSFVAEEREARKSRRRQPRLPIGSIPVETHASRFPLTLYRVWEGGRLGHGGLPSCRCARDRAPRDVAVRNLRRRAASHRCGALRHP